MKEREMGDQPLVVGSIVQLNNVPVSRPSLVEIIRSKPAEIMPKPVDMHFNYMVDLWQVDFFGDNKSMVFTTRVDKLWVRVWTRVFFRSKWTRL
jgi:hypothetical protein